mgnify:CR=1 FL=1
MNCRPYGLCSRIYDNMIGVLFAVCCTVLFSLLERHASSDEAPATNRSRSLRRRLSGSERDAPVWEHF